MLVPLQPAELVSREARM